MMYEAEDNALAFLNMTTEEMDGIMGEVVESVDKISEEIHG